MWRLVLVIVLALLGLNLGLSWGVRPRVLAAAVPNHTDAAVCPVAKARAEADRARVEGQKVMRL